MAIIFKEIKWKNFLSTGNNWTTIKLNESRSTLIIGRNGAGKSTLLDAISFSLYGKPFRNIKKNQLVNSINKKKTVVEISFMVSGKDYRIVRGISPNIFEIYKEDVLLNQDASVRDYQSYLEENVLKLNFKSFGQIVVLGSSTFVPFMQLPASNRRVIIEDLLDIQVFTMMNGILKQKISENTNDIREYEYALNSKKERLKSAIEHNKQISTLKEERVSELEDKIKEFVLRANTEEKEIEVLKKKLEDLVLKCEPKSGIESDKKSLSEKRFMKDTESRGLKNELNFYRTHDSCNSCNQKIDEKFKTDKIENITQKLSDICVEITDIDNEIDEKNVKLSLFLDIEKDINDVNYDITIKKNNIKNYVSECKSIYEQIKRAKDSVEKIDKTEIIDIEKDIKNLQEKLDSQYHDKEIFSVVSSMLKDGGIKSQIVKQYVPVMNSLINKYLSSMGFFVKFELDENFNETIKSRHRDDFSYSSFSEGEKLRIDLALLFTWREISKLRNSVSTNLLIMDEILDSSLDNEGTDDFLKIIQEMVGESNIFVISHKGNQLLDKFDDVIRFEKSNNYSHITEV